MKEKEGEKPWGKGQKESPLSKKGSTIMNTLEAHNAVLECRVTLERALHFSPSSVWKEWFYHESEKKMMEWHVHEATE